MGGSTYLRFTKPAGTITSLSECIHINQTGGDRMRLLHTADLHLDSAYGMNRFSRDPATAATQQREVLTQIVDLAVALQPDALAIAGDLFHVPYLKAETKRHMARQFSRLGEIPVLIAPGNHDPYVEYRSLRLPDNVRVFSHRWAPHELGTGLVWGYGHYDADEPGRVLERLRVRDRRRVNVVLFHGSDLGVEHRKHARFAGFTRQEMQETGADYFALGHIHWATNLHGLDGRLLGCYPGAPRGLESGTKGTVAAVLATVTKRGVRQETFLGTTEGFVPGEADFSGADEEEVG